MARAKRRRRPFARRFQILTAHTERCGECVRLVKCSRAAYYGMFDSWGNSSIDGFERSRGRRASEEYGFKHVSLNVAPRRQRQM